MLKYLNYKERLSPSQAVYFFVSHFIILFLVFMTIWIPTYMMDDKQLFQPGQRMTQEDAAKFFDGTYGKKLDEMKMKEEVLPDLIGGAYACILLFLIQKERKVCKSFRFLLLVTAILPFGLSSFLPGYICWGIVLLIPSFYTTRDRISLQES